MKCVSDCVSNNAYTTRLSSLDLWLTTTGKIIVVARLRVLVPPNSALPLLRKLVADDESAAPDTAASQFASVHRRRICKYLAQWHYHAKYPQMTSPQTKALRHYCANRLQMTSLQLQMHWWVSLIIVQQRWVPFCADGTSVSGTYMTYCDDRDLNSRNTYSYPELLVSFQTKLMFAKTAHLALLWPPPQTGQTMCFVSLSWSDAKNEGDCEHYYMTALCLTLVSVSCYLGELARWCRGQPTAND